MTNQDKAEDAFHLLAGEKQCLNCLAWFKTRSASRIFCRLRCAADYITENEGRGASYHNHLARDLGLHDQ